MKVDARTVWGPKLWRCFHLLAASSDRNDVGLLWASVMRATSEVLPCAACRTHITQYLRTHVFMKVTKIHLRKGEEIRVQIIKELHTFHNAVNARLGKPQPTLEEAMTLYTGPREKLVAEARTLYEELKVLWGVQSSIRYREWIKVMSLLLVLVEAGPT